MLPPYFPRRMVWEAGAMPLLRGPRFIRAIGWDRWHRVRAGYAVPAEGCHDVWLHVFCGRERVSEYLTVDVLPPADEVCATCVGLAIGCGLEAPHPEFPTMRHTPRDPRKPLRVCPGGRQRVGRRVGYGWASWMPVTREFFDALEVLPYDRWRAPRVCGVCGDLVGLSSRDFMYSIQVHAPGPGLPSPCQFHSWRCLRVRGVAARTCTPFPAHRVVPSLRLVAA